MKIKMANARKPLIVDIKGNSLDDGPGIRTVVFFKGCPLACVWCHNPECKNPEQEISFNKRECVGCKTCKQGCPLDAFDSQLYGYINRSKCTLCMKCVDACPSGALSRAGKAYEVRQVTEIIHKDLPFFKISNGGVTLSGGEPTLFMNYCSELLQQLKSLGIHTLIETSGLFHYGHFMDLIYPHIDIIYYDIKLLNAEDHKRYCGVPNELILSNFVALQRQFLKGGKPVLPRIPLVPDITATDGNLRSIANFLRAESVKQVAILPYNPLWIEKSETIGERNLYVTKDEMRQWMPTEQVQMCQSFFSDFELV
ncbi:MAG: glycyl-radical enzyme activating protein [Chloroflexi bacterium]|nr:glycyl-radical enzyme activating protein [Chloroflexota bacterium]